MLLDHGKFLDHGKYFLSYEAENDQFIEKLHCREAYILFKQTAFKACKISIFHHTQKIDYLTGHKYL